MRRLALSSSRQLSSCRRWRCLSTTTNNNNNNIEVTQTTTTTTKSKDNSARNRARTRLPSDGLTLGDFVQGRTFEQDDDTSTFKEQFTEETTIPQPQTPPLTFHIKTYGCQMNVNDSDIVRSLLTQAHFQETEKETDATLLLTNTCAIREGAETKVWHRLKDLHGRFTKKKNKNKKNNPNKKIVGVLGCMAERLKENLFKDGLADLVVGPDAYRDLPNLVHSLLRSSEYDEEDNHNTTNNTAVNVQLSLEETYADVTPIRHNPQDVSAFVSVMRGCNNMCSYCVVPFTRGRERSRPFQTVLDEAQYLVQEENVKEIVLLGQNVNSYHDKQSSRSSDMAITMEALGGHAAPIQSQPTIHNTNTTTTSRNSHTTNTNTNTNINTTRMYQTSNEGFTNLYKLRGGAGYYFCDLVEAVSNISPELRVRFTSPHPKDYPPELLSLMAERPNVCNQLHMPAQSGSSSVLSRMRRGYTREAYLRLIDDVRSAIPDVALSSDFITGFCDETSQEHLDTLSLMEQVQYDQAYMFAYSMRGKTHAHRKMTDNVSPDVKKQRLQEVIHTFRTNVQRRNEQMEMGRLRLVLVEGESRKSTPDHRTLGGRTDQNKRILFPYPQDNHNHNTPQQQQTNTPLWTDDMIRPLLSQLQNGTSHQDVVTNYLEQSSLSLNDPTTMSSSSSSLLQPGDYAVVEVTEVRGHTLRGRALWKTSLSSFAEMGLFHVDDTALRHASNLRTVLQKILPPENTISPTLPPHTSNKI